MRSSSCQRLSALKQLAAPFRGTVLHYAVAYLDAVCLGAVRDLADRQVVQAAESIFHHSLMMLT